MGKTELFDERRIQHEAASTPTRSVSKDEIKGEREHMLEIATPLLTLRVGVETASFDGASSSSLDARSQAESSHLNR